MADLPSTVIEVQGCRIDTAKLSNDTYVRALEVGLYGLIVTGQLDIRTILADVEVKVNIVTFPKRRIDPIQT